MKLYAIGITLIMLLVTGCGEDKEAQAQAAIKEISQIVESADIAKLQNSDPKINDHIKENIAKLGVAKNKVISFETDFKGTNTSQSMEYQSIKAELRSLDNQYQQIIKQINKKPVKYGSDSFGTF